MELKNENSLSAYKIEVNQAIVLENLQNIANKAHSHDMDFNCKIDLEVSTLSFILAILFFIFYSLFSHIFLFFCVSSKFKTACVEWLKAAKPLNICKNLGSFSSRFSR